MLKEKKGISPMIATVLLIGLVIAIALLAILWGKNYIEELAEKRGLLAEKQQQCNNVDITAVKAEYTSTVESGQREIEVVLKNKRELTVNKFVFRVTGSEKGEAFESYKPLKGLEVKPYPVKFPETGINSIDVIPHLQVVPGHYVPCSKQSIRVNVA